MLLFSAFAVVLFCSFDTICLEIGEGFGKSPVDFFLYNTHTELTLLYDLKEPQKHTVH